MRNSEGRWRIHEQNSRRTLAAVPVAMTDLRAETERIASRELIRLVAEEQLDLAGNHVANLFALVRDQTETRPARRHDVDIALEQMPLCVRDDAFYQDPMPPPHWIHLNSRSLACACYNRGVFFLPREQLSEAYIPHQTELVQHLQRGLDLVVFDLGNEAFRAAGCVRNVLQT